MTETCGCRSVFACAGIVSPTGFAVGALLSHVAGHFDPEHIRTYQIYLTNEKKLAPSSIYTAIAAIRLLYRIALQKDWTFGEDIPLPRNPLQLRVVLSPEEVMPFLSRVDCNKHRMIPTACYAAGLGISEAVHLKAAAIDSLFASGRAPRGPARMPSPICCWRSCAAGVSGHSPRSAGGSLVYVRVVKNRIGLRASSSELADEDRKLFGGDQNSHSFHRTNTLKPKVGMSNNKTRETLSLASINQRHQGQENNQPYHAYPQSGFFPLTTK
jgi:hypothetical protein